MHLYEDIPDPVSESIIRSVLKGNRPISGLRDKAINGVNWRMAAFYQYGRDHYTLGLADELATIYLTRSETVEGVLATLETDPVTIERISLKGAEPYLFVEGHLVKTHGYNRWTNTVTSLPGATKTQWVTNLSQFTSACEASLDTATEALRTGIPTDRTESSSVTYKEKPATKVTEYTIRVTKTTRFTPYEKTFNYFVDYARNPEKVNIHEFIITLEGRQELTGRGTGIIQYQATAHTHYVLEDGSKTPTTVEILPAVTKTTGVLRYSEVNIHTYTDVFLPVFNPSSVYTVATYYTTDDKGKKSPKYFIGVTRSPAALPEDHYDIDLIQEQVTVGASVDNKYYPMVPLIKDGKNMFSPDNVGSGLYETSIELMRKLDLDALTISDAIQSSPDIDSVDEAYFMLAIPIREKSPAASRYFHTYLRELYEEMDHLHQVPVSPVTNDFIYEDRRYNLQAIGPSEDKLTMRIWADGLGRRLVTGRIGKPGTAISQIDVTGDIDKFFTRMQISEDTYEECMLQNPYHESYIYADGRIKTTLRDVIEDLDNSNFVVPVRHDLVSAMPAFLRQELHYMAPMIICHAYEKRKLKWYESTIFKSLLIIVSIVVAVYTGMDIYSTFIVALTATGSVLLATVIVMALVIEQYLIALAIGYLVDLVGVEAAFVAAVAMVVASFYGGTGMLENYSPADMLRMSTTTTNAISTNIQKDMLEFQAEVTAFQEEAESLMDELEQKQKLLQNDDLIDPFTFVDNTPFNDFKESPSDYYRRQLNTNIAPLAYASIEYFVDASLILPKSSI
ncbi:hypothetical protein IT774_07695 [Salinimonas marina]|uniref:TMhelix containing protein n=1 Tax=Salinimonas marina TaxID=2785918 RepID=A0A7S9E0C1_9ALTE|nr:hypothetical protein [Salinimonas marina]QPG06978.1 hypothetical protein IT774_07695 [Salinimonas marina]